MNTDNDTLTDTLIREWYSYYHFWAAAHNSTSLSEFLNFTDTELRQAMKVCRNLNRLTAQSDPDISNIYNRFIAKISKLMPELRMT